jgi:hypothetical protein
MTTKQLLFNHKMSAKILTHIYRIEQGFKKLQNENPNIPESVFTEATAQLWADYKTIKKQIDEPE